MLQFIKIGLYLVLLTPLVFSRSLLFPFVTLKVFIFNSLIEIIFALWFGLAIFHKEYRPRFNFLSAAIAIFFILLVVSSIFGIDFERSLWSTQSRAIGLVSLFHFGALFLILSSIGRQLDWERYFTFSFCVGSIISLATIAVAMQIIDPYIFLTGHIRPGTFFGNPSFTASYLLSNIFIGMWLLFDFLSAKRNFILNILLAVGVLLNIAAVFLTETRGAILGLAAGLLALLIYFSVGKNGLIKKLSIGLLILMIIFSGIFWLTRNNDFWSQVPGLRRATPANLGDIEPRPITWVISWHSFLERPTLGFGFENFRYPFDRYYDPKLLRFSFGATFFDKPHNVFLEYLVNAGILGFLAFMGIFATAFYILFKKRDNSRNLDAPFLAGLLVAYLVQNFFLFDTFGSYLTLFIILAFIGSRYFGEEKTDAGLTTAKQLPRFANVLIIFLLILFCLPIYFINYKILHANNRQYWGLNYFLNRMPELALDAYAQSLTVNPNPYINDARSDFSASLSQTYAQGMDIPDIENVSVKAMSEMAAAINRQPNNYLLRLNFANISAIFYVFNSAYLRAGEEQAEQALKLSPQRQEVYYALAKIKVIQGDKAAAFDFMKKAMELDPKSPDPHFYYGLTALEAGDQKLGFDEINKAKAMGREPQNWEETRVLANYYGDAGDYEKAISLYLTAVSWNINDLESLLKLGIVYFYNNQSDLARAVFVEFLKQKPDFKNMVQYEKVRPIFESVGL